MKLERVSVRYGELRSTGYPEFSNLRHEVEFTAEIEPGETAAQVEKKLSDLARTEVKKAFGDADASQCELDLPRGNLKHER